MILSQLRCKTKDDCGSVIRCTRTIRKIKKIIRNSNINMYIFFIFQPFIIHSTLVIVIFVYIFLTVLKGSAVRPGPPNMPIVTECRTRQNALFSSANQFLRANRRLGFYPPFPPPFLPLTVEERREPCNSLDMEIPSSLFLGNCRN